MMSGVGACEQAQRPASGDSRGLKGPNREKGIGAEAETALGLDWPLTRPATRRRDDTSR
jgi:hypothetical protein